MGSEEAGALRSFKNRKQTAIHNKPPCEPEQQMAHGVTAVSKRNMVSPTPADITPHSHAGTARTGRIMCTFSKPLMVRIISS